MPALPTNGRPCWSSAAPGASPTNTTSAPGGPSPHVKVFDAVSGNLIRENKGVGIWADVADDGRVISGNKIQNNAADGVRYEISRNGVIENNTITGNGFGTGRGSGTSLWDGAGINVNTPG